jgi:Tfp pilus assembly protein FimT
MQPGPRQAVSRCRQRGGTTLLELLAVVTLIAIFATVAIARYGRTVFGNFGAESDARRVALAMLAAKRSAISTGLNHGVQFGTGPDSSTTFSVVRIAANGSLTVVDGPTMIPKEVTVAPSASLMVFTFEGQASAAYTVGLSGNDRSWQISVVPITGSISTAAGS